MPFCSGLASSPGGSSAKSVCPSRDELSKPALLNPDLMTASLALNPKPQTPKPPITAAGATSASNSGCSRAGALGTWELKDRQSSGVTSKERRFRGLGLRLRVWGLGFRFAKFWGLGSSAFQEARGLGLGGVEVRAFFTG